MNALETAVETWFTNLFRTHRALKGKEFRHSDDNSEAEPNVITLEAKQGKDLLEGPKGPNGELRSEVAVTASYRSTAKSTRGENDLVADAIQACIRTANTRAVKAPVGFFLMILNEGITGDRDHTKSTRTRTLTIPVEAGLLN